MPLQRELSIGQIARRTGLAVSAIRFYEAEGLVTANRNAGGQRRFKRADIRRLSFVIVAQKFGFSIARIRQVMSRLPEKRTLTEADWQAIAQDMRAELDAKIAALQKMRDDLDSCIGCGCLSMKRCALYNADDVAAAKGAGPRYLMGDTSGQAQAD